MESVTVLTRSWKDMLADVFQRAEDELVISSPYITDTGARWLLNHVSEDFRASGRLHILTDLSPMNVCQGATEPRALVSLAELTAQTRIVHLPRVHAKAYVADSSCAIVTSGNLTRGGLEQNYECGLRISDPTHVDRVRRSVLEYANLGGIVDERCLMAYCRISDKMGKAWKDRERATRRRATHEFDASLQEAQDELIRSRLAGGTVHAVFARTVLYLLRLHGVLGTERLHALIEGIHPDLCDNTVERVIDGQRYGKKWKHAVRNAQQHLKRRGLIELVDGVWRLVPADEE